MTVGQPGGENYIGDYIGVSAIGNTSYVSWMDSRNGGLGSYTGYYPDFAMSLNNTTYTVSNNDSVKVVVKIPSVNGPFSQNVKFSATLDSLPTSGNISFSFQNGKDSITNYPDSVILVIKVDASVPTRGYKINITGKGTTGPPVHIRKADLLVNSSLVTVGTNRPGVAEFKINGVTYTTQQQVIFTNGTNITVQALSPRTVGLNQYVFVNWSNGGDTTQTITVNSNLNLFATYKVQYKLLVNSTVGNTFGGNVFHDSGSTANFGVLSRIYVSGGTTYYFRGWTGGGTGSYTSADSTGLDSSASVIMRNAVTETARWTTTVGINQIGSIVPDKYNLYQNYPNPFNPVTNIKFDLIKTGNVKIIIYDLLGKEVEVLLNDILQPGSYKADFNGDRFSSGIYYYKIVTDDFTDVKKMLLIK